MAQVARTPTVGDGLVRIPTRAATAYSPIPTAIIRIAVFTENRRWFGFSGLLSSSRSKCRVLLVDSDPTPPCRILVVIGVMGARGSGEKAGSSTHSDTPSTSEVTDGDVILAHPSAPARFELYGLLSLSALLLFNRKSRLQYTNETTGRATSNKRNMAPETQRSCNNLITFITACAACYCGLSWLRP